jgi:hypothetical protein
VRRVLLMAKIIGLSAINSRWMVWSQAEAGGQTIESWKKPTSCICRPAVGVYVSDR